MESLNQQSKELMLFGIPASPGIAHGPVFRFLHEQVEVLSYQVEKSAQDDEISRFMAALEQTKEQVSQIREDVSKNLGEKEAGIFDAHMLVLEDKALIDDVCSEVRSSGDNVEQCVFRVTEKYQTFFEKLEDQYLRERASDLRDISSRLLRNLAGATSSGTAFLDQPIILVSEDLTPSDTASLDRSKILGIATNSGGQTSHAVIMARASGVPAVVGLRRLTEDLSEGDEILIDGFEGVVIINPSETTLYRYGKVGIQRQKAKDLVDQESDLPAETQDGKPITLWGNADTVQETELITQSDAVGIGLYRTESLYLSRNALPSEEEQYEEYAAMVRASLPKTITIRTLDLGGDKILDAWSKEQEENPFMGFRAIRYCLSNPPIFLDQLRAILRASAHGKVRILLPMISGLGEVTRAKEFIFTAKRQLTERGLDFDPDVEVGCMLETPAAVAICDLLAAEVDFFSVGTNDLVQYLLAVDRVNNRIAFLYEPHHPAVIRILKSIFEVTKEKEKSVTVCGEIAGDPHFLPLLLGLGLTSFSASVPLLPDLKFFARRFTMDEAVRLTRKAEKLSRPSEVKELLKNFYEEKISKVGKEKDGTYSS